MNRYQRQQCLMEVGQAGQHKINAAHILVVGAGGLGCAVLPYLVGAGIAEITLVDPDQVSLSNLHRQVLYREADVGFAKVECAKKHLQQQNPSCIINTHCEALTPSNVNELCQGVDIVLDCADTFAVSYILSDCCYAKSIKLVSASALGFQGYVGGFCGGKPSLRAVFPELPQRANNCSTAGVMGAAVGTIGCMQAQFALNLLLDLSPSPLGQLLSVDLRNLRQSAFRFDDATEPDTENLLSFIASDDLSEQDWVVDLRGLSESNQDNADFVHYLNFEQFDSQRPQPDAEQRAVMVCRTGLTAWRAARALQQYWRGKVDLIALGDQPLEFDNA